MYRSHSLVYKEAMGSSTCNSNTTHLVLDVTMRDQYESFLDQFTYESVHPLHHNNQLLNSIFPALHMENNNKEQEEEQEHEQEQEQEEELGAMKEMMYKIAVMQPVDIDPAMIQKPQRRNIRISDDPQSVAARHRRERISERIRILQRLVPGGTKMDTASMLDEAIQYVKFLKKQVQELQTNRYQTGVGVGVGHVASDHWGMGIGPMQQGFSFRHAAGSTSSMGPHVCFNSEDNPSIE